MSERKYRKRRQQLIFKLEKEISKLEEELKNIKRYNTKARTIKNLKISVRACQLIFPFVLSAGIVTGGAFALGSIPFKREERKYIKNIKQEIDSFGNVKCVEKYGDFEDNPSTITYYSKWEKTEDNFYKRNVEIYTIDEKLINNFLILLENNNISSQDVLDETSKYINEELLLNILKKENISSIEDILGELTSKKVQIRNDLTEKQINSDSYIEALIYDEIEDEFIMVKQSVENEIAHNLLYIIVLGVSEILSGNWRKESSFSFSCCYYDIKEKYKLKDIQKVKNELEIKKQKYKRLNG